MSFFRRPPRSITPVDTKLTAKWFDSYFNSILTESGVSADDGQNLLQITWFAQDRVLDDVARKGFMQLRDAAAREQYDRLIATGAGPADRVSFLVGWNAEMLDIITAKLDSNKALMLQAGRMHGRFRFVPSACCGEPVEFSLTDGSTYCSQCRRRI